MEAAIKKRRNPKGAEKAQAIRLGMLGEKTMEEVATKVGVSRATVGTWSKAFREAGIAGVLQTATEKCGRKGRLEEGVQSAFKRELTAGSFKRAKEARQWLAKEHGITMSIHGVYYWLGKVGGVLKVPRKTHARKDAAAAES